MNVAELGEAVAKLLQEEMGRLDSVSQRVVANRVLAVLQPWLPKPEAPASTASVTPMTDVVAKEFSKTPMKYGKHAGTAVGDVPRDYLAWLADSSLQTWKDFHAFLNSEWAKRAQMVDGPEDRARRGAADKRNAATRTSRESKDEPAPWEDDDDDDINKSWPEEEEEEDGF